MTHFCYVFSQKNRFFNENQVLDGAKYAPKCPRRHDMGISGVILAPGSSMSSKKLNRGLKDLKNQW